MEENEENSRFGLRKGGRNLLVLGLVSIVVALSTTGVSLAIYHNSGDIYLDRSRPGYLPDEDEIEQDIEEDDEFEFPKNGKLDAEVIEEYLEKIDVEVRAVDLYEKAFDDDVLSDENLGIVEESGS